MQMKDSVPAVIEFLNGRFKGDSGGHDMEHSLRVCRNAVRIQSSEGGDLETI